MKRMICIALGIMLCAVPAAVAQTGQERAACRGDAFRLCTPAQIALAAVGDRQGIYACFAQHRNELSRRCDRVLKLHGY
jgi:hypothetical protein